MFDVLTKIFEIFTKMFEILTKMLEILMKTFEILWEKYLDFDNKKKTQKSSFDPRSLRLLHWFCTGFTKFWSESFQNFYQILSQNLEHFGKISKMLI